MSSFVGVPCLFFKTSEHVTNPQLFIVQGTQNAKSASKITIEVCYFRDKYRPEIGLQIAAGGSCVLITAVNLCYGGRRFQEFCQNWRL
jgi:hypothetical protein